jgi:chromosome segregation ATPase
LKENGETEKPRNETHQIKVPKEKHDEIKEYSKRRGLSIGETVVAAFNAMHAQDHLESRTESEELKLTLFFLQRAIDGVVGIENSKQALVNGYEAQITEKDKLYVASLVEHDDFRRATSQEITALERQLDMARQEYHKEAESRHKAEEAMQLIINAAKSAEQLKEHLEQRNLTLSAELNSEKEARATAAAEIETLRAELESARLTIATVAGPVYTQEYDDATQPTIEGVDIASNRRKAGHSKKLI